MLVLQGFFVRCVREIGTRKAELIGTLQILGRKNSLTSRGTVVARGGSRDGIARAFYYSARHKRAFYYSARHKRISYSRIVIKISIVRGRKFEATYQSKCIAPGQGGGGAQTDLIRIGPLMDDF